MQTTGITPQTSSNSSASSNSSTNNATSVSQVTSDEFLKLLVTQLQNQDPLNPISNSDFAAQLAQFSTLGGIEKLNTSFSDLLLLQELTQGANLVGKTVVFQPLGQTGTQTGIVDAADVQDGKLQLSIGGSLIPLSQVRGITTS